MRSSLLLSLLLVPLCSACLFSRVDSNEPISEAAVESLQPGVHTATDVLRLLGGPTQVVQLGRGSAYGYDHRTEKQAALLLLIFGIRGVDERSDRVWAFFDENNLLVNIGSSLQAGDAEFELPFLGEDDK